jgi:tetratricopeptide (TPR) repeat protein
MRIVWATIVVAVAASVANAQDAGVRTPDDAIAVTRELYASASYAEALAALERLKIDARPEQASELERYEVLCLMALGRADEAERAIERLVTRDPLYRFDASDASPRVRLTFSTVRRRVLPGVVRSLYAEGKRAYDRKAYAEAAEALERVLQVIAEAEAESEGIDDLQTLASGFLELSRASLPAAQAASPQAPSALASVAPIGDTGSATPSPTEPVAIRQELPKWTFSRSGSLYEAEFRGAIEVDIDESGVVVSATIVVPIHPNYDPLLLDAARSWTYQPATRNGKPIRAQKRIAISLRPR